MPNYEIILNEMKYSFSSINTFNTCKYSFLELYINVENRLNNAFGEFGSFVHLIIEKYFKDELEIWNLSSYYKDNYSNNILCSFPTYPPGMANNYYEQGLEFFENFQFDKEKYDIILIEKKDEVKFKDIKIVFIPDLVLKNKETGIVTLYDWKTANMFKGDKVDKKKLEEFKKQVHLYAFLLWLSKEIKVDNISIWAIRNNKFIDFPYSNDTSIDVLEWFEDSVKQIKKETEWDANTKNQYYCYNLCSFRDRCGYINGNLR
jgi:hypothetical protein